MQNTITRDDIGPLVHCALRKVCDSDITTIAYLVICADESGSWGKLARDMWDVTSGDMDIPTLVDFFDSYVEKPHPMYRLILTIFEKMSEEDLKLALAFIHEEN
jgi:hypothetical protein